MGLIDRDEVWEAALGIYDLSLAALVARLSGKVLRLQGGGQRKRRDTAAGLSGWGRGACCCSLAYARGRFCAREECACV
jgi:hypothetical protein